MGVAVRAHADDIVAGRVGNQHVIGGEGGDAERIRLPWVPVRVVRIRVGHLVRGDVEDGFDGVAGCRLSIQDQIAADGPAGAIGRGGDIGDVDRVRERGDRAARRALEGILEGRTGWAVGALAKEDRGL